MFNLPSIYRKLHTNARLTSEEGTEVRRAMDEPLNRLKVVECEIARLEDRYSDLRQRMVDTEQLIEVYRVTISPIRRIAPEILQEIFWRCLPTAHNSIPDLWDVPLVLCRVCTQWRQIAYSTPKLWSSLHIAASPLTPGGIARLEAIDAWLTRSGILPLSISMSTFKDGSQVMGQFRPYFDLISKYARRWKCIHLRVEPCDEMNFLQEVTADDFPLLEVFHLHRDTSGFDGVPIQSLWKKGGILSAPSLRALSINDVSVRTHDLPVHFRHLTGLGLEAPCLDLSNIIKVLKLCSNLVTCAMTIKKVSLQTIPILQSPNGGSGIILPKLRLLKIYGRLTKNSDFLTLLGCLSTPALRHFAYERFYFSPPHNPGMPERPWSSSLDRFRSFFERLNEPLQELEFLTDGLEAGYVAEFLHLFPELKRLSLRCTSSIITETEWAINDRLLQEFIPHGHRSHCQLCSLKEEVDEVDDPIVLVFACLGPKLEVFRVETALVSKHTLFEYLRSRLIDYDKYNIGRLRRFSIAFTPTMEGSREKFEWKEVDELSNDSGVPTEFWYHFLYPPASTQPPRNGCRDGIREIFGVESTRFWG